MPNASWGMVQQLWNDGIGALFGNNLMTIGGFFLIFLVFVVQRTGAGAELAVPLGMAFIFILTVLNPGLLPTWVWTAALFIGGIWVFLALKRVTSGY